MECQKEPFSITSVSRVRRLHQGRVEPVVSERYLGTINERPNNVSSMPQRSAQMLIDVIFNLNGLKPGTKNLLQPPWYEGFMCQIVETAQLHARLPIVPEPLPTQICRHSTAIILGRTSVYYAELVWRETSLLPCTFCVHLQTPLA